MGARGRERYLGGVVDATMSTTTTASHGHNAQEMSPTQKYSTKKTHFQLEHPVCPALSLNYAHITSCLCCLAFCLAFPTLPFFLPQLAQSLCSTLWSSTDNRLSSLSFCLFLELRGNSPSMLFLLSVPSPHPGC